MKILITTDLFKPSINGVVTSVLNLTDQLIKEGHEVKILTLSKHIYSIKYKNIYYMKSLPLNVYPGIRLSVLLYDELIEELINWKPDVIHTQCEFFTYSYGKYIAKRTGAPIIHTYHTMYEDYSSYVKVPKELGKHMVSLMSKSRLKDATIIITPTDKVRKKLRSYNITKEIKTIPTGLDLEKFNVKFKPEYRENILRRFKIDKSSKVLLYLGRLGKEKNLEELLENFSKLLKRDNSYYLIIVGGGPYKKNLEHKIYKLGIINNVKMTGMISPTQIPYYYKSADVFVSSSQSETQGLTYIEALANGLPLVCKYDQCLEDVLIDGENGFFFNNDEEFLKKIETLFSDRELYCKMKREAIKKSKTFSKESFCESVLDVYKLGIRMNEDKPKEIDIKISKFKRLFNLRRYIKGFYRFLES